MFYLRLEHAGVGCAQCATIFILYNTEYSCIQHSRCIGIPVCGCRSADIEGGAHQTNHALMSLLHYIISAFSHTYFFFSICVMFTHTCMQSNPLIVPLTTTTVFTRKCTLAILYSRCCILQYYVVNLTRCNIHIISFKEYVILI